MVFTNIRNRMDESRNVSELLKKQIDTSEYYWQDDTYSSMLIKLLPDLPGYPKVEIDGDPSQDIHFVTSENYNEEKYELLDLESFEVVKADEEEVIICGGSEAQGPFTLTIKLNERSGKLYITDIYNGFTDGMELSEFNDYMENI